MTCETMTNTATAARSAPCCAGALSKAANGCAAGCSATPTIAAELWAGWHTREEGRPLIESQPMPPSSGPRAIAARPETGASRSALIRRPPERVVGAAAFLALIVAGMIAGACIGAVAARFAL
jgi:hypothetical protein